MLKNMKYAAILEGILALIISFFIFQNPLVSLASYTLFIGISLFVHGIIETVMYFVGNKQYKNIWNLINSILTLLFGFYLVTSNFFELATFIPIVFAVWITVSSLIRIFNGVQFRDLNKNFGNLVVVLGILALIVGIILFTQPLVTSYLVAYLIAGSLLYQAFSAFVDAWYLHKYSKTVEVETEEVIKTAQEIRQHADQQEPFTVLAEDEINEENE